MVLANLFDLPHYPQIVVRGAGDLGSGVAYRLHRSGYSLLMTELAAPLMVRRAVCFGSAVLADNGRTTVEGIVSEQVTTKQEALDILGKGTIPVMVVQEGQPEKWRELQPEVVVDARMAKRNIDTKSDDAPLVIGLGPGFTAGEDCDAVIETNRGHRLGRVIWEGQAEPNTGIPGKVKGKQKSRVLRAPRTGHVTAYFDIGDTISMGDTIATVDGFPITASFDGVLRGIIDSTVRVEEGFKIGDLDPRGIRENCFTISDKALAIGGGVLEAILARHILPISAVNEFKRE